MTLVYTPKIGRRIAAILFVTQSLASAGMIATFTVNPIVGAKLSGNDALAGLPGALLQIGAATAAYPAGRLMARFGRRPGLTAGFAFGMSGMLVSGMAIMLSNFLLFLCGLALIGMARGIVDQSRYAAADAQPLDMRARAISTTVFASTVGAIGGPALVAPLGKFVETFGMNPLAGPMFGGSVLMLIGGIVLFMLLRPDPRDIARVIAAAQPTIGRTTQQAVRTLGEIVRQPRFQLATIAMVFGQTIMVLVMQVTSLHMSHHNHGLGDISIVFGAHTLGMFGVSFVTGYLADRVGRPVTIALGAIALIVGALLAPVSLMTPWIALALFLVGFGWNLCYIGGSTLLSDALSPAERGQYQGLTDLAVNISAASSSLGSGFIMAAFGYGLLCLLGAGLALVPLMLIGWQSVRGRAVASVGGL